MINILRNIRTQIEGVVLVRARIAARRQLLSMSERKLADLGISRELLEQGVQAWPWKTAAEQAAVAAAATDNRAAAIRELQALSDSELLDIGINRGGIADAVINGRPGIDYGVDRQAA